MKYFLSLSLILLCFSKFDFQGIEDNEDFETEEVDPVDTNEEEEDEEESSALDLDLIPSLNPFTSKRKEKTDSKPDETPLTSFVSNMEKGTVGLLGKVREQFTSRVQEVGSHIQEAQQRINKRFQNGVTDVMQTLQHQIEGK